jgi:hypothetical protein
MVLLQPVEEPADRQRKHGAYIPALQRTYFALQHKGVLSHCEATGRNLR